MDEEELDTRRNEAIQGEFYAREDQSEGFNFFQSILMLKYGISDPILLASASLTDQRVINPSIASFHNLVQISFTGGYIERIECLESLSKLRELNLSRNSITEIKNLDRNYKLQSLILDHNLITKIKYKHLKNLRNLKTLSLKSNQLNGLRWNVDVIAKALPQLEELNFQEYRPIDEQTQNMVQDWGEEEDEEDESGDDTEGEDGMEGEHEGVPRTIGQAIINLTQQLFPSHNHVPPLQPEDFYHIERVEGGGNDESGSVSMDDSIELQEFHDHGFIDLEEEEREEEEEEDEREFIHESPICQEKMYRDYVIFRMKNLKILDGIEITESERDQCESRVKKVFELSPFEEERTTNISKILSNRRIGRVGGVVCKKIQLSLYNSVRTATFEGEGVDPSLNASNYPKIKELAKEPRKRARYTTSDLRNAQNLVTGRNNNVFDHSDDHMHLLLANNSPRQFEYSSGIPHWMVYGTNYGLLVLHNHINDLTLGSFQMRERSNIFGLHWLKNHPTKFVSGNDCGDIYLVDGEKMARDEQPIVVEYERFSRLSSVTVNSTDSTLLSSGARKVAIFDVETARTIACHKEMHLDNVNVLKFSNTNPNIFATSSFDKRMKVWDIRTNLARPIYSRTSDTGLVMLTWSPDDKFILTSGSDNEVRQYEASTGKLDIKYKIPKKNQTHNYTRSYYTNNGDYMITGSCEESVVRMYSTKSGKLLREVELKANDIQDSCYIQSLRGDPNREFLFTVLLSFKPQAGKESKLLNVNLLEPSEFEV
eukprot:TRINITY_DN4322_c1_g1_i2.p1 TRINITY_DN4322_c1_g1~~TRINITY_DN4322_c1_g1_i2.p1  ORF type:complete len:768 (-),score=257.15 TRINITY_DN4322_c1_g1_i2:100-2403(-)